MISKDLDLQTPNQEPPRSWTSRSLFGVSALVSKVVASFKPAEILLGVSIVLATVHDVTTDQRAWFLYTVSLVLLFKTFPSDKTVELTETKIELPKS